MRDKYIYKMNLGDTYQPKVKGFGEIYEIESVKSLQKKLFRKYRGGSLFLSSNITHSGRGVSLKCLEKQVKSEKYRIIDSGYVDSPFWKSKPRDLNNKNPLVACPLAVFVSRMIAGFMINLEFIWKGEKRSHMVYVLGKKG